MSKLNLEAHITIQTLARQQVAQREIARLLGVTEGAVRYPRQRMATGTVDGCSGQSMRGKRWRRRARIGASRWPTHLSISPHCTSG